MARFRSTTSGSLAGSGRRAAPREHQGTIFERLDELTRRAGTGDPVPAATRVFFCVLGLMGIGFLVQLSHSSTTIQPDQFMGRLGGLLQFRLLGLLALVAAFHVGPARLRHLLPLLTLLCIGLLIAVYLPGINAEANGSRRWVRLPFLGLTLQPSEVARVVMILWVADRCVQLGPRVQEMRRYLPMLGFGLVLFAAILGQPDLGGGMLFLLCFVCTMWVGGARPAHVAGSLGAAGGGALLVGFSAFAYTRERIAVWLGESSNDQVSRTAEAMASGDLLGVGLTHGGWRNHGLQYMQNDYAFSLVGEELGLVGVLVVIGLLLAFAWNALKLVLSIPDRFNALVAFGLLISVALQAMLHIQVVTGLAPPKGINLPFISDGGSSLVASCLAVGLALGSVRRPFEGVQGP